MQPFHEPCLQRLLLCLLVSPSPSGLTNPSCSFLGDEGVKWAIAQDETPPRVGCLFLLGCGAGVLSRTGSVLDSWGEGIGRCLSLPVTEGENQSHCKYSRPSERQDWAGKRSVCDSRSGGSLVEIWKDLILLTFDQKKSELFSNKRIPSPKTIWKIWQGTLDLSDSIPSWLGIPDNQNNQHWWSVNYQRPS